MGHQCWTDNAGRAWLEATFESPPDQRGRRQRVTKRLVADLGCVFECILSSRDLARLAWREHPGEMSNYGWLTGGVVRIAMPELECQEWLPAYANARVARLMQEEGFDGIAGKPFLDQFHWSNGAGGELCLESWTQFRQRQRED
jgi:hypothetical protein